MLTRRTFLEALAALPAIGKLTPTKKQRAFKWTPGLRVRSGKIWLRIVQNTTGKPLVVSDRPIVLGGKQCQFDTAYPPGFVIPRDDWFYIKANCFGPEVP